MGRCKCSRLLIFVSATLILKSTCSSTGTTSTSRCSIDYLWPTSLVGFASAAFPTATAAFVQSHREPRQASRRHLQRSPSWTSRSTGSIRSSSSIHGSSRRRCCYRSSSSSCLCRLGATVDDDLDVLVAPVAIGMTVPTDLPDQSPSLSSPTLSSSTASILQTLWASAQNATAVRGADTSNQGHDSFRYEWGTWVVDDSVDYLRYCIDNVRVVNTKTKRGLSVYERLLQLPLSASAAATTKETTSDASDDAATDTAAANSFASTTAATSMLPPRRFRLSGGTDWDAILHVLPPNTYWQGRWPTGSWSMCKALTGLVDISALSVNARDASSSTPQFTTKTQRKIRGGSDGSLGSGQSTNGDDCCKYVGGRLRRYTGTYGQTILLEVVIRPPVGFKNDDCSSESSVPLENLPVEVSVDDLLTMVSDEDDVTVTTVATVPNESSSTPDPHVGYTKMGLSFDAVGGLDKQLDAIVRRVLASRANPAAARRLGISHVRGILLSGPPGCGKTLLARELARLLGAREPQIVNGPEILDKYIGEAEKKVRELFAPAELEYKVSGDDSALHIIILDEMDAIARKRGTMTSDTTGVRDSVVNQLLAKMDGVKQASNVLVVGLTNRPELLDPALLRPGRLEVQLRIELPDLTGRRDILRIHTRQMRLAGGLRDEAIALLEDVESPRGMAVRTEHYSGAELAGLIRSAASFALGRTIENDNTDNKNGDGVVTVDDLEQALLEVKPALGRQDEVLKQRFPFGISACSTAMERIMRDLTRFASSSSSMTRSSSSITSIPSPPRLQSLLLVGSGAGAGATALAAWAASQASANGSADYIRLVTALDLLTAGGSGEEARAAALVERFVEAKELSHSLLVLDDVDQLCAGSGGGYSSVMLATLRALLRVSPTAASSSSSNNIGKSADSISGGQSTAAASTASASAGKSMRILATTSRSDAACVILHELFDETIVIPLLDDAKSVTKLYVESLLQTHAMDIAEPNVLAELVIDRLGAVGCKTALRLAERAVSSAALGSSSDSGGGDGLNGSSSSSDVAVQQRQAMTSILDDLVGDTMTSSQLCNVL